MLKVEKKNKQSFILLRANTLIYVFGALRLDFTDINYNITSQDKLNTLEP